LGENNNLLPSFGTIRIFQIVGSLSSSFYLVHSPEWECRLRIESTITCIIVSYRVICVPNKDVGNETKGEVGDNDNSFLHKTEDREKPLPNIPQESLCSSWGFSCRTKAFFLV